MKRNDFLQIKNLDEATLLKQVLDLKKEMTGLVMDKKMSNLKDLKTISKKKKDVAQLMTVLRQKQMLREAEEGVMKVTNATKETKEAESNESEESNVAKEKKTKKGDK